MRAGWHHAGTATLLTLDGVGALLLVGVLVLAAAADAAYAQACVDATARFLLANLARGPSPRRRLHQLHPCGQRPGSVLEVLEGLQGFQGEALGEATGSLAGRSRTLAGRR